MKPGNPWMAATLIATACLISPTSLRGEPSSRDVESLDAVLGALYDVISGPAGQPRDWDRLRALFAPGARLVPVRSSPDGAGQAVSLTVDEYIERSRPILEEQGFFEKEVARRVESFGRIAQVFSTYEARRSDADPEPFVRGINSIQLLNDGTRWWVVTIFWDSESPDRPIPERYLTGGHQTAGGECFILQPLDDSKPYISDPVECAVGTAPASTFKIPHALIALDTGVVTDPLELVEWDGSKHSFDAWQRDHSLDSAMKASVVWFFQRTAAGIGRERMREGLKKLDYAKDSFEGEITMFWLNGDLLVSPEEQVRFLRRLVRYELPFRRQHVDAVKAALLMPSGKITNAAGVHDFELTWPALPTMRAKTGYTAVGDERVSWLVGQIEAADRQYVFASRVRAPTPISGTAGTELARRMLNARAPQPDR